MSRRASRAEMLFAAARYHGEVALDCGVNATRAHMASIAEDNAYWKRRAAQHKAWCALLGELANEEGKR